MFKTLQARLQVWLKDASIQRLLKNTSFLFSAQVITTLISVVQFPIVSRWLGPENYGLWGLASSWIAVMSQLFGFRVWEAVVKFLNQFMAENDDARALAVIKLCVLIDASVNTLIFLLLILTSDLAAPLIYKSFPAGVELIRLEALSSAMVMTMSIWMAVLRVFDKFKRISFYNVIWAIVQFVLWMLVVTFNGGISGLIITAAFVRLGQTASLAILAQRELNNRFHRHWFTADLNALFGYRRPIASLIFSMSIDTLRKIAVGNADILILGWFGTPVQVGIYRLAKQLSSYLSTAINPIYDAIYPEIVRIYSNDGRRALKTFVKRVTQPVALGWVLAVVAGLVVSPWLIPLFFGPDYIPVVPVFSVILFSTVWVLGLWAPSTLIATGRARHLTVINTIMSLLMILMLLLLVPPLGAMGAAISYTGFYTVWLLTVYPAALKPLNEPAPVAGAV
jgi:O-antigen/teichoic acid export membrane protein